jgi:hypothetical protein
MYTCDSSRARIQPITEYHFSSDDLIFSRERNFQVSDEPPSTTPLDTSRLDCLWLSHLKPFWRKYNFDFERGWPSLTHPPDIFGISESYVSTRYNDLETKKKIRFLGGDPLTPPLQTFSAPATLVSTIYNDLEKKKKFRFLGGDPP